MSVQKDVRPSPIAGRWYESNPSRLSRQVDAYLDAARIPIIPAKSLSGRSACRSSLFRLTAAHAFKTVQEIRISGSCDLSLP